MTARLPITDGLRALAIVAVVLFHVFPSTFPGGFIGVDVFFVISGFVIAYRYLPAMAKGEVRFRDFFFRRVQRLVPAYAVLLIVVTIAAYLALDPMDLSNYGKSLAAQAGYVQNFVFWRQGEYFDKAQFKPLLHTWSLAVEEQFYLFFPLLALFYRRSGRLAVGLLAVAFVASLALGMIVSNVSPKTSFYMLPMRAWEFIAGMGAALLFARFSAGRMALPLFAGGLAMILLAALGFTETAVFPGVQAALAVAGTVIVCLVQKEAPPRAAALLTNPLSQHFGRISYSWYLWHWPITVFFYVRFDRMPNLIEGLGCLVLGYLLGVASYRYVEQPGMSFRALRLPRPSLALLAGFLVFSLAAGLYLSQSKGALHRYPPEQAVLYAAEMDRVPYRCPLLVRVMSAGSEVCELTHGEKGAVLLHGDSHADRMKGMLSELVQQHGMSLYLTQRNCKVTDYGRNRNCSEDVWATVESDIRRLNITKVVVVAYWSADVSAEAYRRGVKRLIDTGATVYLQKVSPNGAFFDPVPRAKGVAPERPYTLADYNSAYAVQNRAFAALEAEFGRQLQVLDPTPLLCPGGACDFATGGKPNYLDTNHLNSVGVARIASIYSGIFSEGRKTAAR